MTLYQQGHKQGYQKAEDRFGRYRLDNRMDWYLIFQYGIAFGDGGKALIYADWRKSKAAIRSNRRLHRNRIGQVRGWRQWLWDWRKGK